jgi:type IV secretion system protein VirB10
MEFMKKVEQNISGTDNPYTDPILDRTSAPAPLPLNTAEDKILPHQQPAQGIFFNKKRVGIIVAGLLIILFSGAMFAMTGKKAKQSSDGTQQVAKTGDIPSGVSAPPSTYSDLQNRPKGGQQSTNTQQQQSGQYPPVIYRPTTTSQQLANQQAAMLSQRDLDNALKSSLRFSGVTANSTNPELSTTNGVSGKNATLLNSSSTGGITADQQTQATPNDENGQLEKNSFLSQNHRSGAYAKGIMHPSLSPYEIKSGTVIPGVMISGLNSDLPGQVIAQVRENVYDSLTGQYLLIPQGTKIIGVYDSKITYGQDRALVVWTRLILPNGNSLDLENLQGSDEGGYSGFQQHTDNHDGRVVTAVLVSGLLSAASLWADNQTSNGGTTINIGGTAAAGATQAATNIGNQMASKALNLQPTIKIDPGYRFNIMVTADFILAPYEG